MRKLFLLLIFSLLALDVQGADYFVRTDGSNSTNCTGLADDPYDGSGTAEACAWNHPFYFMGWWGDGSISDGGVAGIASGGDDLIITCNDQGDCTGVTFNVGYDASWTNMSASWTYGGFMRPIPDGSSGNHTIIKGCSKTSGCGTESKRPKFLGNGRNYYNLNLLSSDYVDVEDIDFSDTATCGSGHPLYGCGSADSAEASVRDNIGITGATNILIKNSRITGAYRYGVFGGSTSNIEFDNADLSYNSMNGYDGDSCGSAGTCGASGYVNFKNGTKINWNGCVMTGTVGTIATEGCAAQDQGVVADGLGMGNTSGAWLFEDMESSFNTGDGIDLLYCNRGSYSGCTLTVRRSKFEGNAGNPVKGPNDMDVQASKLISNCGFHYGLAGDITLYDKANTGRSGSGCDDDAVCESSENSTNCRWVDGDSDGAVDPGEGDCPYFNHCRANGNALAIAFYNNNPAKVLGNTIVSNGDVVFEISGTCSAGSDVDAANNIVVGGREFNTDNSINSGGGDDTSSIFYNDPACDADFDEHHNLCIGLKEGTSACNGTGSNDSTGTFANTFTGTLPLGPLTSPGYYQGSNAAGQIVLKAGSTAIDVADSTVSGAVTYDFNNFTRTGTWDAGSEEYGSTPGEGGGGEEASAGKTISGALRINGGLRL